MPDLTRLHEIALSDAGFVFDPMSGHTYNVNSTGLAVLNALKSGESPGSIASRLSEDFEIDADHDVTRDLEEFLSQLREHGLIR